MEVLYVPETLHQDTSAHLQMAQLKISSAGIRHILKFHNVLNGSKIIKRQLKVIIKRQVNIIILVNKHNKTAMIYHWTLTDIFHPDI